MHFHILEIWKPVTEKAEEDTETSDTTLNNGYSFYKTRDLFKNMLLIACYLYNKRDIDDIGEQLRIIDKLVKQLDFSRIVEPCYQE